MELYDTLASNIDSEYELFLFALMGRYQEVRAPGVELTPRALVDFEIHAWKLGKTFCVIADKEINRFADNLLVDASEQRKNALYAQTDEIKSAIRKIVAENVAQAKKTLKTGITIGDLIKGRAGTFGTIIQARVGKINFTATDSAGRVWKSAQALMKFLVRDYAYVAVIQRQIQWYSDEGCVEMVATNAEATRFSLSDSWSQLRPIFHPNSHSEMRPYVPS